MNDEEGAGGSSKSNSITSEHSLQSTGISASSQGSSTNSLPKVKNFAQFRPIMADFADFGQFCPILSNSAQFFPISPKNIKKCRKAPQQIVFPKYSAQFRPIMANFGQFSSILPNSSQFCPKVLKNAHLYDPAHRVGFETFLESIKDAPVAFVLAV